MSGHSKWSTIKHKKAASDAKRGKIFTRIAKEITIAAREGGGDPSSNTALRLAVANAKVANMPKDNIEKAIKRGTGEIEGGDLVSIVYEAYGPHSVGILIEVVTDNRNRAIADVRHAVSKYGGSMAEAGAVSWQFKRKGYISITDPVDQDELFMVAAEAGADDIQFNDEITEIYVELDSFRAVQEALEAAGYSMDDSSLIFDPANRVELNQASSMQVLNLIETAAGEPAEQRLQSIFRQTNTLIATYRPDRAAVEQLFFGRNITTAIAVGQARGVLLLALADAAIPMSEYSPPKVKEAVTGYGKAEKAQMQLMVRHLLNLEESPHPDDAADALAVAITHARYVTFEMAVDRSG